MLFVISNCRTRAALVSLLGMATPKAVLLTKSVTLESVKCTRDVNGGQNEIKFNDFKNRINLNKMSS